MTETATPKPVVRRHTFEGSVVEGQYDVYLGDAHIGRVERHDGTPNGYFGRWSAGRFYTDTRASAVNHLVRRHLDREAKVAAAEAAAEAATPKSVDTITAEVAHDESKATELAFKARSNEWHRQWSASLSSDYTPAEVKGALAHARQGAAAAAHTARNAWTAIVEGGGGPTSREAAKIAGYSYERWDQAVSRLQIILFNIEKGLPW